MKVVKESKLTESKEKLPISFLTDFVSRSWDDVGYLKETIASIKESFSGTKKVEELLQALVDAYLVCIGQLELHLQAKDYLDTDLGEKLEEAKKLTEDVNINISEDEVKIADDSGEVVGIIPIEPENVEIPAAEANIEPIVEPVDEPVSEEPFEKPFDFDTPEVEGVKKFEKPEVADFFVDFDDPVGEPVTEKELYGEGEEPIEDEKIDEALSPELEALGDELNKANDYLYLDEDRYGYFVDEFISEADEDELDAISAEILEKHGYEVISTELTQDEGSNEHKKLYIR